MPAPTTRRTPRASSPSTPCACACWRHASGVLAELSEFVTSQASGWDDVLRELRAGRKTSHWIWWVFPQLAILGRSHRARHFGLSGLDEAAAYLAHPVLGPRLVEVSQILLTHAETDPETILGAVDALKVRSCMTLFEAVPGAPEVFAEVLDRMYDGARCPITREAIGGNAS
ncbi:calpastatin [Mameliella alba]|nr:calpastatin [Mameliella alba]